MVLTWWLFYGWLVVNRQCIGAYLKVAVAGGSLMTDLMVNWWLFDGKIIANALETHLHVKPYLGKTTIAAVPKRGLLGAHSHPQGSCDHSCRGWTSAGPRWLRVPISSQSSNRNIFDWKAPWHQFATRSWLMSHVDVYKHTTTHANISTAIFLHVYKLYLCSLDACPCAHAHTHTCIYLYWFTYLHIYFHLCFLLGPPLVIVAASFLATVTRLRIWLVCDQWPMVARRFRRCLMMWFVHLAGPTGRSDRFILFFGFINGDECRPTREFTSGC